MLSPSIRPNRKTFKISAMIAFVSIGMIGITAETPETFLKSSQNREQISRLNLIKPEKVIISRYEVTDPTTGAVISVSQIKNQ